MLLFLFFLLAVMYVFHTTRNKVIALLEQGKHQEALQLLKLTRPDLPGLGHGVDEGIEMVRKHE